MSNILEIHDLTKMFGGHAAVSNVDLNIKKSDIHCLLGPNGAGKSTLFKLIVGAHQPTSGKILFKGLDVTHYPTFQRVKNGMSIKMQKPSIFRELSVRQNIETAIQYKVSRENIKSSMDEILQDLDLSAQANQIAGELSHGQQQWLEIGMAVALDPDILLMDEPTAGLSPEETFRTGELILKLNKNGMTVVVVEHDMSFIKQIAQTVTVLHYGKLFAQGNLETIINDERVAEIYLGKSREK